MRTNLNLTPEQRELKLGFLLEVHHATVPCTEARYSMSEYWAEYFQWSKDEPELFKNQGGILAMHRARRAGDMVEAQRIEALYRSYIKSENSGWPEE